MNSSDRQLALALIDLGVTPLALDEVRRAPPEKGPQLLEQLKRLAKSRYKKLAFELHPDRNPGNQEAAARLSYLSSVFRDVEKMAYQAPVPAFQAPVGQVAVRRVVVRPVQVTSIYGAGAQRPGMPSTSSPRGAPRPLRVVLMRPT